MDWPTLFPRIRKEKVKSQLENKKWIDEYCFIRLKANEAFLGKICDFLRMITIVVNQKEKKCLLNFYYDKVEDPILAKHLEDDIINFLINKGPKEYSFIKTSIIIPWPERIPQEGHCMYCRYEE